MKYFEYGEKEVNYLKGKDKKLSKAIEAVGHINREVDEDLFSSLINSIAAQQISTKAANTVSKRLLDTIGVLTVEKIAETEMEILQGCGLSMRKVSYMKDLAKNIIEGDLILEDLYSMSDDEVCRNLVKVKGIGVWTAEMAMIFSMQRQDVLSFKDMAIIRGMRMLYGHKEVTKELFEKYKKRYSPYGSVASLYLWAISSGAYLDLIDPAISQSSDSLM